MTGRRNGLLKPERSWAQRRSVKTSAENETLDEQSLVDDFWLIILDGILLIYGDRETHSGNPDQSPRVMG